MPEWIVKYWVEWAFGIVAIGLTAAYRSLAKRMKKRVQDDAALRKGVIAMLHDRLYQSCRYYIKKGWVDTEGLENLEYLYKSYHDLGGNGTGTALYERVKDLPYKERED